MILCKSTISKINGQKQRGKNETNTVQDIIKKDLVPYICIDCGYEENIPKWLIEELFNMKELLKNPDEYAAMTCPECEKTIHIKK